MISDQCSYVMFGAARLNEGYAFFGVQFGPFSFKISVNTCKCSHTHQLKQIQEVCPHFLKIPGTFLRLFPE